MGIIGGAAACAGTAGVACVAGLVTAAASANHAVPDVSQAVSGLPGGNTPLINALLTSGISQGQAINIQVYVDRGILVSNIVNSIYVFSQIPATVIALDTATQNALEAGVSSNLTKNSENVTGNATNAANSINLNNQLTAEKIANGHAFEKHVIDQSEFGGMIVTQDQFANQIESILNNTSFVKQLSGGCSAYWDDTSGVVVIRNPSDPDGGTAFKPTNGITYFNNLR